MIDSWLFGLTLISALGCGLIAGVFFVFSAFVMKALARLPPAQGIAAMQSNDSLKRGALFTGIGRAGRSVLAVAALALGGAGLRGQTPSVPTPAEKGSLPMQQFVFLFRPGPTPLSETDQTRRAEEVLAWALRQNNEGRKLDPRKLGEEHRCIGPPDDCGSLANILFLEARDFAEAVKIAETRPFAPPASRP